MAAILQSSTPFSISKTTAPFKVCFSFAAYAKNIINYLRSLNIPIEKGLTSKEFSSIESIFHFKFPPDLRSILQEGLPIDPGFPNWRSASNQQLDILINLPVLGLLKEVSRFGFWVDSWGIRPDDSDEAVDLANGFLKKAPVLVPIYRNFYIPPVPFLAGNPVFYVKGSDIRIWCYDLSGFFQRMKFQRKEKEEESNLRRPSLSALLNSPAWAATVPRRIEFWTAAVEWRERAEQGERGRCNEEELGEYLDQVFLRLRNGGWKEDDVKEMMMITTADGCDRVINCDGEGNSLKMDGEDVLWYVEVLSKTLLSAGWSTEDVADTLGVLDDQDDDSLDFYQLNNHTLIKG